MAIDIGGKVSLELFGRTACLKLFTKWYFFSCVPAFNFSHSCW